ncbi:hypothetical protein [Micromonospora sp. IBSANI012]|uniref:hypothetical protein n=1 Tax=Micromonospora sp. IBSANI012 TaxID=3457761 RepID=UPI004059AB58
MRDLTVADIHTCYVVAAGVPVLVPNIGCEIDSSTPSPVTITIRWEQRMPKSQFRLKAAAMQRLSDEGVLFKALIPSPAPTGLRERFTDGRWP